MKITEIIRNNLQGISLVVVILWLGAIGWLSLEIIAMVYMGDIKGAIVVVVAGLVGAIATVVSD